MTTTTIASLGVGAEDPILEAKVYRKWVSKTIPEMKELVFCRRSRKKKIPITFRYNFKATVADGTATADFTFFTEAGEKVTGHSCSDVMQKFHITDKTQLPVELVNTIGKNHIFQTQLSPNTQKGAGKFVVEDVPPHPIPQVQQHISKEKVRDSELNIPTFRTAEGSTNKNSDMPGTPTTPPPDIIETIAETILATVPHRSSEEKKEVTPTVPTAAQRYLSAKRSLNRKLITRGQKKIGD